MNYFGMVALLVLVAVGAWIGSASVQNRESGSDESGVYQNAIEDAKEAAKQMGDSSAQPNTTTEPAAVSTTDPGIGKSVTVYDGISVSAGTTVLNLSGKGLSGSLKAEVRFLSNLKELNLSDNNFTGLPAEVGQLSTLEILNLSNNSFTGLPHELANLKNLKVLNLQGTNYASQDLEVIRRGLPASTQILVD